MNHYVVAPDGQKYGPADMATLNAWITDGRLHPQSFLEEEGTGRRLPASSLPGLRFAPAMPPANPMGAYPRYGNMPASAPINRQMVEGTSHGNFLGGIGLGFAALFVSFFFGYGSIILSIWSIRLAWRAKEDDDHPAWWVGMGLAIVSVGLAAYFRFGVPHNR